MARETLQIIGSVRWADNAELAAKVFNILTIGMRRSHQYLRALCYACDNEDQPEFVVDVLAAITTLEDEEVIKDKGKVNMRIMQYLQFLGFFHMVFRQHDNYQTKGPTVLFEIMKEGMNLSFFEKTLQYSF